MAVRRRSRPAPKAGPAASVRVHDIKTLDAWRAALAKAQASRRLLVVQLYQVRRRRRRRPPCARGCSQLAAESGADCPVQAALRSRV